ncbi:ABC transporter permease [Dyadobacter bucti]|uniref:ABC transporter permease n=1 Tax=Dyadobacter bucti TaxID=2572203 RepID=UPI001E455FE1|nr:ABC transporter permease [Dyadobacter bucti]
MKIHDTPPPRPPRWAQRLLSWYCKPSLLEDLQGDLNEYFERNLKNKGARRARLIYVIDVLKFLRPYTIRKPEFLTLLIHFMMIGSYFKTSRRSLVRNKLFSFINVFGLAVSMSVGLLVIAFISDLFSYDDFHEKKNRIYRVITSHQPAGQREMNFASTSVKAGKSIKESVPGVDDLTILRSGFSGDAAVGSKTLPVEGLWTDPSFLRVFSFPLIQGDPASALREPYSLIVTQKTAQKLFGSADPLGEIVRFDTLNYTVTGVMEDIPKLSHLQFEALVSFQTLELQQARDPNFTSWENIWQNYVYIALPEKSTPEMISSSLDKINKHENAALQQKQISISLQPLKQVVTSGGLSNSIGPTVNASLLWILAGLAFVIILSACFNYTNLSIARSLRRTREVGIRKVIGALKGHVLGQFITESVIISMLALAFSFTLFLVLRKQFLSLDPHLARLASFDISPAMIGYFIGLSVITGIVAGFFPALFFSRVNAIQVIRDSSSLKVFRHLSMRKALIVTQYTISLIFITTTLIGYKQYRGMLTFDLGYTTRNIVNMKLHGNKPDLLKKELAEIPEVAGISKSMMVTSLGSAHGAQVKYEDARDSAMVWQNLVDENYLPLHKHRLLAGKNFALRPKKGEDSEVIVNEELLKRFDIAKRDPEKALGKNIIVDGRKLTIVGVLKDFHYGTLENRIEPVMLRYSADEPWGYLNISINSKDPVATMAGIENAWRKIDKVHPLDAKFYDDQIEEAYSQFSVMIKVIGFITFLAICIASMGLFGMVVFTTETRLKEISIRKVLGASETGLVYLLSKGFLLLLTISALIALPVTYLFFDKIVLQNFPYHQPIGVQVLFSGLLVVMLIAFFLIGSQTLKASRRNPAKVLKSE